MAILIKTPATLDVIDEKIAQSLQDYYTSVQIDNYLDAIRVDISENTSEINTIKEKFEYKLIDKAIYGNFSNVAWLSLMDLSGFSALGSELSNFSPMVSFTILDAEYIVEVESTRFYTPSNDCIFFKDQVKIFTKDGNMKIANVDYKQVYFFRIYAGDQVDENEFLDPNAWTSGVSSEDLSNFYTKEEIDLYLKLAIADSRKSSIGRSVLEFRSNLQDVNSFEQGGLEFLRYPTSQAEQEAMLELDRQGDYKELGDYFNIPSTDATFKLPIIPSGAFRNVEKEAKEVLVGVDSNGILNPILSDGKFQYVPRTLGSLQKGAIENIWGIFDTAAGVNNFAAFYDAAGAFYLEGLGFPLHLAAVEYVGSHTKAGIVRYDPSRLVPTADEVRMDNVACQLFVIARVLEVGDLPNINTKMVSVISRNTDYQIPTTWSPISFDTINTQGSNSVSYSGDEITILSTDMYRARIVLHLLKAGAGSEGVVNVRLTLNNGEVPLTNRQFYVNQTGSIPTSHEFNFSAIVEAGSKIKVEAQYTQTGTMTAVVQEGISSIFFVIERN